MDVLVVGLRREGSGKTTVARGAAAALGAEPFKPFAAGHLWKHWSLMAPGLPERLHGRDARLLAEDAGGDPYGVNPVHRVWVPRPAARGGGDAFGLDRVWTGEEQVAVVNRGLELAGPLRGFVDGCDDVVEVGGLGDEVFRELHVEAARERYRELSGDVVVESYTDVAQPVPGMEPDLVLAVEPFRLHLFDGSDWARSAGFLRGRYAGLGRNEVRVEKVLEMEEPVASAELPLLDEFTLDAIREKYVPVVEELLER